MGPAFSFLPDSIPYLCAVKKLVESRLPISAGAFKLIAFGEEGEAQPHLALIATPPHRMDSEIPLVRVHSECMTGDVFGSTRCDCGEQLNQSLLRIAANGGCLIYLRQEGRGIGLVEKLKAYNLQDDGMDTVEANLALGHPVDARDFQVAAEILNLLELGNIRLLTNNPEKVAALQHYGIVVERRESLIISPVAENEAYLAVKKAILGHWLD